MRRAFLFVLMLSILGSVSTLPGQDKTKDDPKALYAAQKKEHDNTVAAAIEKAKTTPRLAVSKLGREFQLVSREQMRLPRTAKSFGAAQSATATATLSIAPKLDYDWTKGNSISFPLLGNVKPVGDCYYAACAHLVQTWRGMNGLPDDIKESALVGRYLNMVSSPERGLTSDEMLAEFAGGIVGPNGPYAIDGFLQLKDITNRDAVRRAQWAFGGSILTCRMRPTWRAGVNAGDTFDADSSRPDPQAGHAMLLNGINADDTYKCQTWGFNPPIHLTQAGLEDCDAELFVCFSRHWFNKFGVAPNGLGYKELSDLWVSLGGAQPPARTFPKPTDQEIEPKVAVSGKTVTVTIGSDVFILDTETKKAGFPGGWNGSPVIGGNVAEELKTAGVKQEIITPVIQMLDNLKNNKGTKTTTDDLTGILRALPFPPK